MAAGRDSRAVDKLFDPLKEPVVNVINSLGSSQIMLVCEHASNAMPAGYQQLGLTPEALASHIAYDPGALDVARSMSSLLDAPLVTGRVSRLLVDCNRAPSALDAMPARAEIYTIPGNENLSPKERNRRIDLIHRPFHQTLADCLAQHQTAYQTANQPVRRAIALVAIHSFTPIYNGIARHLDIGMLHDEDSRLADSMLHECAGDTSWRVRRNEPYGPGKGVMYTINEHAISQGLLNVMIEIRSDLIADQKSQDTMAKFLSQCLAAALARL